MWAHYADQHRGIVIGIDAVKTGFTDENSNLIPAQYGGCIYVSHRPDNPFVGNFKTPLQIGGTHHFPHDHYEKLQRLFLHKPICWSYEEEVRVVKCLKGITDEENETPSSTFNTIDVGGRDLHLYSMPKEALIEVYFGVRSNAVHDEDVYQILKKNYPTIKAHKCRLERESLSVAVEVYQSVSEIKASMSGSSQSS